MTTDNTITSADTPNPGDDAAAGTPGTGENICPHCGGSGRHGDQTCPVCERTGKVTVGIGGG